MDKKKIIINVSIFLVIVVLLYGLLMIGIIPLKNKMRFCGENNWDGSEFEMPKEPFTGKIEIAKCNKAKETDAMIELINSFPFSGKDINK